MVSYRVVLQDVLQEVAPVLQCVKMAAWAACDGAGMAGSQGLPQLAVLVQDCAGVVTACAKDFIALHASHKAADHLRIYYSADLLLAADAVACSCWLC
jgi:hypothetical protein